MNQRINSSLEPLQYHTLKFKRFLSILVNRFAIFNLIESWTSPVIVNQLISGNQTLNIPSS